MTAPVAEPGRGEGDGRRAAAVGEDSDRSPRTVLVLGAGNILLSDEGVGVRVVEALQQRYQMPEQVELLDGGTCGMDLLDVIAGRDHLILVDAVNTGSPPGTVVRYADREFPAVFRTRTSPHQLGLADVLGLLTLLDSAPKRVTVIGVQPHSLDIGIELTPVVAARLDELVDLVTAELGSIGLAPRPRQAAGQLAAG